LKKLISCPSKLPQPEASGFVPNNVTLSTSGQDINGCLGQVVLHAGQVDHPKYLPNNTSKLKHIENHISIYVSFSPDHRLEVC